VPKKAGISGVVASFGRLPFDQQKNALDRIHEEYEQSRLARRAELEAELASLGYGVSKRPGGPRKSVVAAGDGRSWGKRRKGKVKARYRDPKTKETWSGRGRMASWLKAKHDAGEKIEKYLV
jgi:DNA-binding protein H-NS